MSTNSRFERSKITTGNIAFSQSRTTIETAFYGNNVRRTTDLKEAYEMAKNSVGTIMTDMPVFEPEKIGLPEKLKDLGLKEADLQELINATASAAALDSNPRLVKRENLKDILSQNL